uniref:Alpha-glucosidase n=1 Tax=Chromera velia CCMP2878 TaxID=1169474 RepID=A0A0G4I1Z5_9ALVE|eukprot:Cvel_10202.t1-p1 / transcript=Cvel_10202.t1 / gene=Cvel_10202 / organism=Chromera_velia_CCMP2878 / gene_product=Probable retaining alpha-galactosidase, putative / transcript_product=Probable retaining alpha-galactosidase, putative / location=Cvel_scaffold610:46663-50800(+) / protein_length=766 / sequence_SO=supercontig / SO=protein_coding / is_pseudo=false
MLISQFALTAFAASTILRRPQPRQGDVRLRPSSHEHEFSVNHWTAPTEDPSSEETHNWVLRDPDGRLQVTLSLSAGELSYEVFGDGQTVIGRSRLGLELSSSDLSKGLSFVWQSPIRDVSEEYSLVSGKELQVSARGSSQVFVFMNGGRRLLGFEMRCYTEGVAFRYFLPHSSWTPSSPPLRPMGKLWDGFGEGMEEEGGRDEEEEIVNELTHFNLSLASTAFLQERGAVGKVAPAYEALFKEVDLNFDEEQKSEHGYGWNFPSLFKTDKHWILISEAGCLGNYPGTHLAHNTARGCFLTAFPFFREARGLYDTTPRGAPPWATAWRTLTVCDNLEGIAKTQLVNHVSEPSRVKDTSWITPGIVSWGWVVDHDSGRNFESLKRFVDLADEMGWGMSLVDANWNRMQGGGDVEDLVKYASSKGRGKGVKIFLWYNSGGPHNDVMEEPRDKMHNRETRRSEFAKLQRMGVAGVKIDFFNSDKQELMHLYRGILEDAADFELLVNFHGATVPRGWSRTFPHLLTMEAVMGAESYTFFPHFPPNAASANSILPFTRNAVGPMDYTPGLFSDLRIFGLLPNAHQTTFAHEFALPVLFESGLQHLSDGPDCYSRLPDAAQQVLRQIPAVWDEMKVLGGYPGREVVIARRRGHRWFVAGVNGENTAKQMEVDLSPLLFGRGGGEDLDLETFIGDGDCREGFAILTREDEEGKALFSYSQDRWPCNAGKDTAAVSLARRSQRVAHRRAVFAEGGRLRFYLAPMGGFVAVLTPKD